MPYSTSTSSSILFLSIFILAFFPNLFFYVIKLPLRPFVASPTSVSHQSHLIHSACASFHNAALATPVMSWFQKSLTLPSRSRGSYLITSNITNALPEIKDYRVGILHLFIQHTSCGLSLNENWDEDTRADMTDALDRIVPEDVSGKGIYRHNAEGSDDMPVRSVELFNIR